MSRRLDSGSCRARPSMLALTALIALGSCKGPQSSASKSLGLVPADATSVTTIDAEALLNIEQIEVLVDGQLERELAEQLEQARGCGYDPKDLQRLTVANAGSTRSGRLLLVIEGKGFGKEDNVSCAVEALGETMEFFELDGHRVGHPSNEPSLTVFLLDRDRLAVAGARWARPVAALLAGQGVSVLDAGEVQEAHTKLGSEGAVIWYAGELPSMFGLMALGAADLLDGVEGAAMAMTAVDEGLRLRVGLRFGDELSAGALEVALEQGLGTLRKNPQVFASVASTAGVSADVLDSIGVRRDGRWLIIEIVLGEQDFAGLMAKAVGQASAFF